MRVLVAVLVFVLPCLLRAGVVEEAEAQWNAGKRDNAIQLLRDQIAKDPNAVNAHVVLTSMLLAADRLDEADEEVNAAVASKPDVSALRGVKGDVEFREGRIVAAGTDYTAAYKMDQTNGRAAYGVAQVLNANCLRRRGSLIIQKAHELAPLDPDITEAFYDLGPRTPEKVERWQKMLDRMEDKNTSRALNLNRSIAVAKALEGKHAWELASAYGKYGFPLIPLMNGQRFYGYGLAISIGGEKGELQLDTGAGGILIGSRLAEKAGVRRLADSEVRGIGNQAGRKTWAGFAESISIGGLEFHNCIVEVSERGSAVDAGGLIGTNVFRRFLITLDFHARKLLLEPLPGPAWDGTTPVDRYEGSELQGYGQFMLIRHFILVPTQMSEESDSEDSLAGLFLVDTGSGVNMIATNAAQKVTKMRDSRYMHVKGLSGAVRNVYEADKVVLRFDKFRQSNLGLTAVDQTGLSRAAGTEVSGVIGLPLLNLFARVTLDYRDGRIKFEYKG